MIRMATQTHKLLPWESRVRASWRWHRDSAKGQGRPFCGGGLSRFHASAPSASKVDTAKGFAAQRSCTRGREVLQQSGRAWRHQMLGWTELCCRASQRAEEKDGAVQGGQGRQEKPWMVVGSWALTGVGNQPILAVGADFHPMGRDLGPSAGPFRQRRRCLRPLRQWSCKSAHQWRADSWSWGGLLVLRRPTTRTFARRWAASSVNEEDPQTSAEEFVKPAPDVDTLTRRNSCPAKIVLPPSSFALDTCVSQDHHRIPDSGRLYCSCTGWSPSQTAERNSAPISAKTPLSPAADLGCHSSRRADRHV